jgi:hypothetical protein
MPEFKVKKGLVSPDKVPVDDWTTDQMCVYVQKKFQETYRIDTRRPIGQIKIHVNKKTMSRLFILEGRSIDIHPNQLFKDFIDWIIERKNVDNFRIWYLSKEEIMADFLDQRAKKLMDKQLGSSEDFKKQEEKRIEEAREFFGFTKPEEKKGGGDA